eukprot:UN09803
MNNIQRPMQPPSFGQAPKFGQPSQPIQQQQQPTQPQRQQPQNFPNISPPTFNTNTRRQQAQNNPSQQVESTTRNPVSFPQPPAFVPAPFKPANVATPKKFTPAPFNPAQVHPPTFQATPAPAMGNNNNNNNNNQHSTTSNSFDQQFGVSPPSFDDHMTFGLLNNNNNNNNNTNANNNTLHSTHGGFGNDFDFDADQSDIGDQDPLLSPVKPTFNNNNNNTHQQQQSTIPPPSRPITSNTSLPSNQPPHHGSKIIAFAPFKPATVPTSVEPQQQQQQQQSQQQQDQSLTPQQPQQTNPTIQQTQIQQPSQPQQQQSNKPQYLHEDDIPLLEELGIDLGGILTTSKDLYRFRFPDDAVMTRPTPQNPTPQTNPDGYDLTGPFVFCSLLAILLMFTQQKYILVIFMV